MKNYKNKIDLLKKESNLTDSDKSKKLIAHYSGFENYDQDALDIYSNGFKIRAPGGDVSGGWQAGNQVDKTVWYAAWAKHPLVTSGGVPCTAR